MNRLNEEPLLVDMQDAAGPPIVVNIDGYTFANLIVQQSYLGESGFATVPGMIDDVANGDGHTAAQVVAMPGGGHGLVHGVPCAQALMNAFIDDPDAPLDTSCAESLELPAFTAP